MPRLGVSRHSALVAGLVTLVYASLAAMAASCAFIHADASSGHAHHGSQEATPHNALCAWACQATSDAGPAVESPDLATGPAVRQVASSPNQALPSHVPFMLRSRAPPSVPFVHAG